MTGLYTTAFIHHGFCSSTLFHRHPGSFSLPPGRGWLYFLFLSPKEKRRYSLVSLLLPVLIIFHVSFIHLSISAFIFVPSLLLPPPTTNLWILRFFTDDTPTLTKCFCFIVFFFLALLPANELWQKFYPPSPSFLPLILSIPISATVPHLFSTLLFFIEPWLMSFLFPVRGKLQSTIRVSVRNDLWRQINVPRTMPVVNHVLPNILMHSMALDEKVDESGSATSFSETFSSLLIHGTLFTSLCRCCCLFASRLSCAFLLCLSPSGWTRLILFYSTPINSPDSPAFASIPLSNDRFWKHVILPGPGTSTGFVDALITRLLWMKQHSQWAKESTWTDRAKSDLIGEATA